MQFHGEFREVAWNVTQDWFIEGLMELLVITE